MTATLAPSRRGAPARIWEGSHWHRATIAGGVLTVAVGAAWKREASNGMALDDGHDAAAVLDIAVGGSVIVAFGSEGISGGYVTSNQDGRLELDWVDVVPPDGVCLVTRGVARR